MARVLVAQAGPAIIAVAREKGLSGRELRCVVNVALARGVIGKADRDAVVAEIEGAKPAAPARQPQQEPAGAPTAAPQVGKRTSRKPKSKPAAEPSEPGSIAVQIAA